MYSLTMNIHCYFHIRVRNSLDITGGITRSILYRLESQASTKRAPHLVVTGFASQMTRMPSGSLNHSERDSHSGWLFKYV